MGKFVKKIFNNKVLSGVFGGDVGDLLFPETPKVDAVVESDAASVEGLEDEKESTKKQRARLLKTEGGASGQELTAGGVSQRNTLLGN